MEVDVPTFISAKEKYLEGYVMANYSSGAPVTGNITVRASIRSLTHASYSFYGPDPSLWLSYPQVCGTDWYKYMYSSDYSN